MDRMTHYFKTWHTWRPALHLGTAHFRLRRARHVVEWHVAGRGVRDCWAAGCGHRVTPSDFFKVSNSAGAKPFFADFGLSRG